MYGQSGPKDGAALSPADLDRIQAGQLAPDFTLPTAEGKAVTLSGLRDKDVVLVFYRGHW
ncbi:MAG: redoxin domain-containing protein [bacterium]|nr:redoxin domain-containing protein [bacterium]